MLDFYKSVAPVSPKIETCFTRKFLLRNCCAPFSQCPRGILTPRVSLSGPPGVLQRGRSPHGSFADFHRFSRENWSSSHPYCLMSSSCEQGLQEEMQPAPSPNVELELERAGEGEMRSGLWREERKGRLMTAGGDAG